jgi:acetolactate synthase-1/2/3 large subunit
MTTTPKLTTEAPVAPPETASVPLGADAVLRALEAAGATTVFGMPGGAVLPIYDAIARGTTLRHVLVRHEQGAGHMAQGYARVSGRPGVVFATSGPGATNLVTPIADARMDSTALVCVTGQVATKLIGTDAFQECDIVSVVEPLVKRAWRVQAADEIPDVIAEAMRLAADGRPGPVLVDIPRDVQAAPLTMAPTRRRRDGAPRAEPDPVDAQVLARAREELARSTRPVLYVGGGVVNADASAPLLALAERLRIPVVATLMGKGAFPEDHELFFGWPGMHGTMWANLALDAADLVIAAGARFDDRVTGRLDRFASAARVIHLDVDPRELGKLRRPDVAIAGSADRTLSALLHTAADMPALDTASWLDQLRAWRQQHPLSYDEGAAVLKPQRAVEVAAAWAGAREAVWTTGVGQHQMWAMQYVHCRAPRRFVTSGGHGTMGFGLPAAIGAKAARPDATVVCIDGDGSFQMTMQEIATSVAEELPVVVLILNNGHLGMVHQWQTLYFDERLSHVDLTQELPDYAALARALGAEGITVTDEAQLRSALEHADRAGRTTVIDVRVDRTEQCFPMIPPGAAAVDMVEYPGRAAS